MKLSVIIATYNRRESLARCLATLFDQDLPVDEYEIVVVVDGSADGTNEMLHSFLVRGHLVVVEQENQGQTAALNAGVKAARGEIVLFLDDDLLCDSRLLSTHVAAHAQAVPILAFGRMRGLLVQSSSSVERWTCENLERYYERLENDPRPRWPDDAWAGPNCSVARAVFLQSGGYDEKLFPRRGEDVDLGFRLWKMGVDFHFCPLAITSHRWVKSHWQMKFDDAADGASIVRLCRKHPEYRPFCALSGVMSARRSKGLAFRMAAASPAIAGILLGVLNALAEKFGNRRWAQRFGVQIFAVRQSVALLAGARREVGSWRGLTKLFGHRLAILLYHHIGFPVEETEHLSLTVSPAKFLRHVRWLRWRGYTAITPAQWLSWRATGIGLPKKPVLFSFDDAYADLTKHAMPVLEQYGFQSAVFVISGQMGGKTSWDGLPIMTIEQIRHWAARGVEIGAHTRTHPDLTAIPDELVYEEVKGSKDDLLKAGIMPLSFAYPYGLFNDRIQAAVNGVFPLAFTCEEGLNDLRTDPLSLKRTMVQRGDTLVDIELRAAFGKSALNLIRSRLRLRSRLVMIFRYLKFLPH
jgi:glycosyltransferase involved in cell wall biosynthesis/peptidoglycan/xylan/chitin deacetylase (PgdA/CDA1 family)